MKMNKKRINKKLKRNRNRIIGILSAVVLISFVLFGIQSSITGWTINGNNGNVIEKEIEIGVLANTFIKIEDNNGLKTKFVLDDGTSISNQEIGFYLNNNLIDKQITDSEGYAQPNFNLSDISLGTYSFKAMSQGDITLYLNPVSIEEEINVAEKNGIKIIELLDKNSSELSPVQNVTILIPIGNATNLTSQKIVNSTFFIGNNCEEFEENVLWTSGYSLSSSGSTNYQAWHLNHTCEEINSTDCFIKDIEIKTRFISVNSPDANNIGEGYVQISNPNGYPCDNNKEKIYSNYLVYEKLNSEETKLNQYCGNDNGKNKKCDTETPNTYNYANCYGIKVHASQYSLVDVFTVSYYLCINNGGDLK
jgi:hypothetical protein